MKYLVFPNPLIFSQVQVDDQKLPTALLQGGTIRGLEDISIGKDVTLWMGELSTDRII